MLCVLGTLIGLRFIIVHQLIDRRNDLRVGVHTMATTHGMERLIQLATRYLFPLEIAGACVTVLAMAVYLPWLGVLAAGYALWLWSGIRKGKSLPPVSYDLFEDFYCFLWPVLNRLGQLDPVDLEIDLAYRLRGDAQQPHQQHRPRKVITMEHGAYLRNAEQWRSREAATTQSAARFGGGGSWWNNHRG